MMELFLDWLISIDWFRELLGFLAIVCGFTAKWKLGYRRIDGWLWGALGTIFWMGFSVRIESPTGFLNNLVFLWLAIRGYRLWKRYEEDDAART